MSQTTGYAQPQAPSKQSDLRRALLFIAYAAFITTIAQDKLLAYTPLRFVLKGLLTGNPQQKTMMSGFFFLSGLAWYFKPLAGLVVDSFPLAGTRRRSYMIVSSILGGVCWAAFIPLSVHPSYKGLLWIDIALGVFMVFGSTIMGALLVEAGQRYGATGRVSAVREAIQNGCYIISGPVGGWLASRAFGITAGIGATLMISLAVAAHFYLPEKPVAVVNRQVWQDARVQLGHVFRSGTLWAATGLLLLFFISPGFQTPLLYLWTDTLHFNAQTVGNITAVQGVGSVVGAALYLLFCRRFNLRFLLMAGILMFAASTLAYFHYHDLRQVMVVEFEYNCFTTLGALPLYDLATRATPRGGEAMGYAMMMSVRNVALLGGDTVGSWLMEHHLRLPLLGQVAPLTFHQLVWVNIGFSLIALVAVPFLPGILMRHRDGEDLNETGVTGEQIGAVEPIPGHA